MGGGLGRLPMFADLNFWAIWSESAGKGVATHQRATALLRCRCSNGAPEIQVSRFPSSALLPFFGGGFPHNRPQKRGYPYSNLSTGGPSCIGPARPVNCLFITKTLQAFCDDFTGSQGTSWDAFPRKDHPSGYDCFFTSPKRVHAHHPSYGCFFTIQSTKRHTGLGKSFPIAARRPFPKARRGRVLVQAGLSDPKVLGLCITLFRGTSRHRQTKLTFLALAPFSWLLLGNIKKSLLWFSG